MSFLSGLSVRLDNLWSLTFFEPQVD